jgi:hypothetical protein
MLLQSVIATWDLRGVNPVAELQTLLAAPRTPSLALASV